jgi:hypothetical protein
MVVLTRTVTGHKIRLLENLATTCENFDEWLKKAKSFELCSSLELISHERRVICRGLVDPSTVDKGVLITRPDLHKFLDMGCEIIHKAAGPVTTQSQSVTCRIELVESIKVYSIPEHADFGNAISYWGCCELSCELSEAEISIQAAVPMSGYVCSHQCTTILAVMRF